MKLETRAVLAAAYKANDLRTTLTHAAQVVDDEPVRVLCGNVKLDSLADAGATDPNAPPTCSTCLRRTRSTKAAEQREKRKQHSTGPTRDNVVPGNWASVRGGKWHISTDDKPDFRRETHSLCGLTFVPLNVTHGEAPPTNDNYICGRCVARSHADDGR